MFRTISQQLLLSFSLNCFISFLQVDSLTSFYFIFLLNYQVCSILFVQNQPFYCHFPIQMGNLSLHFFGHFIISISVTISHNLDRTLFVLYFISLFSRSVSNKLYFQITTQQRVLILCLYSTSILVIQTLFREVCSMFPAVYYALLRNLAYFLLFGKICLNFCKSVFSFYQVCLSFCEACLAFTKPVQLLPYFCEILPQLLFFCSSKHLQYLSFNHVLIYLHSIHRHLLTCKVSINCILLLFFICL